MQDSQVTLMWNLHFHWTRQRNTSLTNMMSSPMFIFAIYTLSCEKIYLQKCTNLECLFCMIKEKRDINSSVIELKKICDSHRAIKGKNGFWESKKLSWIHVSLASRHLNSRRELRAKNLLSPSPRNQCECARNEWRFKNTALQTSKMAAGLSRRHGATVLNILHYKQVVKWSALISENLY